MTTTIAAGMCIEQEGEGRPIILLHGLGGTSNSFQPLMPALRGRRVIRPDLPGAGRSPTPRGAITIESLVEALVRATAELGVSDADLVGHSFGSLLAQHLACRKPALARRLVLFGPVVEPAETARERLRARAALARDAGMDAIANQLLTASLAAGTEDRNPAAFAFVRESHMRQDAEGFAKSCEALAGAHRADAASLKMPVLIVTGDEDGVGPPTVATRFADELTQGRAVVLAGCGHWTPVERPTECCRLMHEFIRES